MASNTKTTTQFGYDTDIFDPSIKAMVDASESYWGDPIKNRDGLIPLGLGAIDRAMYGLDSVRGGMYLIMGEKKNRKSTFTRNIIANYMTSEKPVEKPVTVIDILESGETPESVKDSLISIVATRYLIEKGHRPSGPCMLCEDLGYETNSDCKQLRISPDFLMYDTRTKEQMEAVLYAKKVVREWPIMLFGSHPKRGNTRDLEVSMRRWEYLIEFMGAKVFVADHVQQYAFSLETSDYEKQLRAVSRHSDIIAKYSVIDLLISQVSLTSLRDMRSGNGKMEASGGMKAAAEAMATFSVKYQSGANEMLITLEEARKASSLKGYQTLEPRSGAFYGDFSTDLP